MAGAGTVQVLCNRGGDNNEYIVPVVAVVVVVVGNVDSWGSFCYSLACTFVACLGAGGNSVRFCFYRRATKLVRGDVPLLFVVWQRSVRGASFVE